MKKQYILKIAKMDVLFLAITWTLPRPWHRDYSRRELTL